MLCAFVMTVCGLMVGRRVAIKLGFYDQPGGRKRHELAVPPIGGLLILPVFALFTQMAGLSHVVPWPLLAGMGVLLAMGAIDDAFTIKPWIKFVIMMWTACFVVVFGHAWLGNLGNLLGFGNIVLGDGMFAQAFTAMALVLLMNAVNMMDGVDGLAGGFAALVCACMMAGCAAIGLWDAFMALGILFSVLCAFLVFNMRSPWRRRASIFMGDSGSLCLGLVIGWFCIILTQGKAAPFAPVAIIWLIGLPVLDAFSLFLARSMRGMNPFKADRRHFHHRFLDAGVRPGLTTPLILGIVAGMALIGIGGWMAGIPEALLFGLWLLLFVGHLLGILHRRGYTAMSRLIRIRHRKSVASVKPERE